MIRCSNQSNRFDDELRFNCSVLQISNSAIRCGFADSPLTEKFTQKVPIEMKKNGGKQLVFRKLMINVKTIHIKIQQFIEQKLFVDEMKEKTMQLAIKRIKKARGKLCSNVVNFTLRLLLIY